MYNNLIPLKGDSNMNEGKLVYLKMKDAKLEKKSGVNNIYSCNGRYYVGFEQLCYMGEEIEHCSEFSTLTLAEEYAKNLPQPSLEEESSLQQEIEC